MQPDIQQEGPLLLICIRYMEQDISAFAKPENPVGLVTLRNCIKFPVCKYLTGLRVDIKSIVHHTHAETCTKPFFKLQ